MYKDFAIYPCYMGLPVIPSAAADNEMARLNTDLTEILEILEYGYDCARSRRKKNVLEKCMNFGNKTIKVAAVMNYNNFYRTDCWLITHVGVF